MRGRQAAGGGYGSESHHRDESRIERSMDNQAAAAAIVGGMPCDAIRVFMYPHAIESSPGAGTAPGC